MRLAVLVEDSSGKALLEHLIPKIIGEDGVFYCIKGFAGKGRIPKNLSPNQKNRTLLDNIPCHFKSFSHFDALVVVLDSDKDDCRNLLCQLKTLEQQCPKRPPIILFRLAIEEMESWYFGDKAALKQAYPKVSTRVLSSYKQDSVCDTWEKLAEALGHSQKKIKEMKSSIALSGSFKHELAQKLGPLMDVESNTSPSFCKLRDGIRRIVPAQA